MDSSLLFGQPTKYHTDLYGKRLVERREFFMLKKAIPLFLMSGLVLGACGIITIHVPNNNETPMEKWKIEQGLDA